MMSSRLGGKVGRTAVLGIAAACGLLALQAPAQAQALVEIPPEGVMAQYLSAIGRLVTSVRIATVTTAQQVADATNATVADFQVSLEEQRIARSYQVTPSVCAAVDANQALAVAGRQAITTSVRVQQMMDARIEGQPNTNAYQGSAQSAQSATNDHNNFYCSALEQANGDCTAADPIWQNRDEQAASIFGIPTYRAGDSDAAYAAIINSTQPYVPRVRRRSEANSVAGQSLAPERRQYNTNISLAQAVGARIHSLRNETIVNLGVDLQRQQVLDGRPATAKASWWDAMNLEIERRTALQYHTQLATMNGTLTMKEVAQLLVLQNQILWATYNQGDQRAMLEAASLAYQAKDRLDRVDGATGSTAPFPGATAQGNR